MKIKFTMVEIKRPDGRIVDLTPERGTSGASGWDLKAAEPGIVLPGQKRSFSTGICLEMEEGWEGQVRSRSGIAKKHSCFVINSPGTVDSDYRGEIVVMLYNLGAVPLEVALGDRIAQLVIQQVPPVSFERVEKLGETVRGAGGLGSTGVSSFPVPELRRPLSKEQAEACRKQLTRAQVEAIDSEELERRQFEDPNLGTPKRSG